jgi:hypothetical protein
MTLTPRERDGIAATHCYLGVRPCGCAPLWLVDMPDLAAETAKIIAQAIRDGMVIERVPLEPESGWRSRVMRCKHKAAAKADEEQATLAFQAPEEDVR